MVYLYLLWHKCDFFLLLCMLLACRLPQPPVFTSVEEERHHVKQRLAGAFRIFSRLGYDEGVAGHITVRDPGNVCVHVCMYA